MKKLYVDTETTGTDPMRHGLHQWSAKMIVDGVLVDEMDLKIQPFPDDVIEDDALEVGGVTEEELWDGERLKPLEAHAEITKMLGRHVDKFNRADKSLFLGYKAGFDADFTRQFFIKCGDNYYGSWFWTPPLCIMTLSGYILQKERHLIENFKLKTVWEYLNEDDGGYQESDWHDSLFDIDRAIEIEEFLRERVRGTKRATPAPLPPQPC